MLLKRLFFPRMYCAALFVLVFVIGNADVSSARRTVATLDAIRIADYVEFTQITLEFNNDVRCQVTNLTDSILQVTLPHALPGSYKNIATFSSAAFSKITFSTDPKTKALILTIPLNPNVDGKKNYWHVWSDLVTIDLPLKVPNHKYVPTKQAILNAKSKLGAKVIVIDPGHGGWNANATGSRYCKRPYLHESQVVLKVAWQLYKELDKDPRYIPVMTRYGDYLPIPFGPLPFGAKARNRSDHKDISLIERVVLGQEYMGDMMISLHMNAAPRNHTARGFEVLYFGKYGTANLKYDLRNKDADELDAVGIDYSTSLSKQLTKQKMEIRQKQSKNFASIIVNHMRKVPKLPARPRPQYPSRGLRVLRQLNMPSVLVEMGFLTNPSDHELFRKTSTHQRVAKALHDAVNEYFFQGKQAPTSTDSAAALIAMNQLFQNVESAADTKKQSSGDTDVVQVDADENDAVQADTDESDAVQNIEVDNDVLPDMPVGQDSVEEQNDELRMVEPQYHIVQRNEVVGDIAKRYGTTPRMLRELNPKMGWRYLIRPGDRLLLPIDAGLDVSAEDTSSAVAQIDDVVEHTVRRGDSLDKIAKQNGTTVQAIKSLNDMRGSRIYPGDKLRVPSDSPAEVPTQESDVINYTVRTGDSLDQIAQEYNTSVESIKSLNNKRGTLIYPGDKLRVQPDTNNSSRRYDEPRYVSYRVRSGDSLWKIAKRFHTDVASLKKANNLRSNSIKPGKHLRIPS